MFIANHFLDVSIFGMDVPDRTAAAQTNAIAGSGSIGAQASLCSGAMGRNPNVLLIDYFGQGDAIGAQKLLNKL